METSVPDEPTAAPVSASSVPLHDDDDPETQPLTRNGGSTDVDGDDGRSAAADKGEVGGDEENSYPNGALNDADAESHSSDVKIFHPLENRWTLWFDNPQKRTGMHNWEKSLKNLVTVDTVEDFWGVYENVPLSSQLAHGANYHLFKEGVRPMWEDPANEQGGKWVFPIPKNKRGDMDDFWLNTVLACIGESFPGGDEICGIVMSVRKQQDRIALWTKHALDEDSAKAAGLHWRKVLGLPDDIKIGYQAHSDALRKNSSFSNADMYIV